MKTIWQKNKRIILSVLAVVLVGISFGFFSKKEEVKNDQLSLVDLSMKMENELGLQNVRVSEVSGNVLEVRVKTPDNVTKEKLSNGAAYIFGYLDLNLNKGVEKVRVIYTVNDADTTLYEASAQDISDWRSKKNNDSTFAKKIKVANLGK
ncbi:MAG: hypothetical protein WCV55_00385 [Candidatus Paceibacterota bacterium]